MPVDGRGRKQERATGGVQPRFRSKDRLCPPHGELCSGVAFPSCPDLVKTTRLYPSTATSHWTWTSLGRGVAWARGSLTHTRLLGLFPPGLLHLKEISARPLLFPSSCFQACLYFDILPTLSYLISTLFPLPQVTKITCAQPRSPSPL